ncbi:Hsp70 family protein [Pedobacter metabolipauper]|uniref:Putative chaperone protein n=1 Tax=Pedobacter metabolipauper TaxID=425513 RepID=A0A4R6T349_9SPHI|nr:Hsp70 family protein [Pedobacter metabolipauper]TDQ11960.1 putative chaperone protein [Pedobacter metabolipauper]
MSKFLYGIDFGTTNSALSIYDEEKKEIIKTITVPSILYFLNEQKATEPLKYVVGEEAIAAYINEGMKGRFMKSVKRILPRSSFIETRIHNRKYTASDLVTLILKELKTKADEIIGYDCGKAIIGRPVFFDDDNTDKDALAQRRLMKAAENAGFTDFRFQFEPIGAAFAYEKTITKKEKVLVADLGGGTTDFTFLELDPDKVGSKNRRKDIIATGGIYIGGDSFDSAFMWEKGTPYFGKHTVYEAAPGKMLTVPVSLFANICSWEQMNFFNGLKVKNDMQNYYHFSKKDRKFKNLLTLTDNNLGYSVFQAIEKTKIDLSKGTRSQFFYSNMEIDIDEMITIDQYDTIINKDIQKISQYLDVFLSKYQIQPEHIDSLFLTGGTSLVSAVKNLFQTRFPNTPIHSGDNFISVAKGLAYSGYLFEEE